MILLDLTILILLIFAYQKAGNKLNSKSLIWIVYALVGFMLGFISVIFYVLTFQDFIVTNWGKDFGTWSFLAATIVIELLIGFAFLELLKRIYSRKI